MQSQPVDNGIVTPGIKVGVNPFKIFVNPDTNKIYVANSESLTISAIDAQTDKVYSTISLKNITDYFSQRLAYDSSQEKFYYVANGNIYTINSVTGDIKFLPVEKVNIEYSDDIKDIGISSRTHRIFLPAYNSVILNSSLEKIFNKTLTEKKIPDRIESISSSPSTSPELEADNIVGLDIGQDDNGNDNLSLYRGIFSWI